MNDEEINHDSARQSGPNQLTGWEGVVFELEDMPEDSPWATE